MHFTSRLASAVAGAALLLALPVIAQAQSATIYGSLGNFDVVNNTGHEAHGFEVELEGLQPNDVYYLFSANRYGSPVVTPSAIGTKVRWLSTYSAGSWSTRTTPHAAGTPFAGTCYQWSPATYPNAGCEHFGVSLRANATRATYRWLIEDPNAPGTLAAVDPALPVATPVYYVAPVAAGAPPAPPVVVLEVEAPEPPEVEAPERFGVAQWVKQFVTQLPREVTLDELVADNPLVVPMDPTQIEVEWDLFQADPLTGSNGNQRRRRHQNQTNLQPTTRTIVRRIELYAYTGIYDPITNEALCADLLVCAAPSPGELGDFISANMTAVNVQPDSLIVTKAGTGGGNIDSSDKVIACGSKCVSPYIAGTQVTLTAKANSGSTFAGWVGACAAAGLNLTCTIPVNGITDVGATFTTTKTATGGGGGGGGGGATGGGTATSYTLSVAKANKGTVTSTIAGIDCGGTCSAKFPSGTAVTLTATPPAGLAFLGWSGACTGTGACTVTISADTKVQASFSK